MLAAAQAAPPGPEQTVETFYRWYIDQVNHEKDPIRDGSLRANGTLTDDLVQRFEKLFAETEEAIDADPVLEAQDVPERIKVRPAKLHGTEGTVEIEMWFGDPKPYVLTVGVVQEKGRWKIRSIQGPE
jgi:hypothetical protein